MGIFTKDKKVETVKAPEVTQTARRQLEQFIKKNRIGKDPRLPTRQIEGLSPLQQELQRLAGGVVTGGDIDISSDVFRDAAQADTDVATSPEFEGFRRQIEELKTDQQTDIRQRAELGGQLKSTPAAGVEAESSRKFDTLLLQEFARMQRQNQQDKLQAAAGLTELGSRNLSNIATVNQIADQERAIEQARNDAVYNEAISTILFPYEQQLRLYGLATSQRDEHAVTGGGLTDLGFAASVGGSIAAASAGA
jgi:hypothetical protein